MDFEHSDQFTQRVEQIIRNFLHIPEEGNPNWKEINQKLDQFQSQLVDIQFFEAIREQLQCDLGGTQIQSLSMNSSLNQQNHPLKTDEVKVNERINQIGLNVYEIEKNLEIKIDLLNNKVENIRINRDELQEQIKSFDARMESQWQGLANVSDQIWQFKKQLEPLLIGVQQQKKKFSLFT
ncbi:unnamed protein product [Paramecium pentaurelia]|uniref:Uncharacterized protein n=1 Tax=Paramecium pentaurelia TaxID=43138 RepID=A0A8S1XIR3_9CILI|nr:unnamed protein product [Paramecium pentaurelia]